MFDKKLSLVSGFLTVDLDSESFEKTNIQMQDSTIVQGFFITYLTDKKSMNYFVCKFIINCFPNINFDVFNNILELQLEVKNKFIK